jgi:hypothetical protein
MLGTITKGSLVLSKNVKIKIDETIVLAFVLYECETVSHFQ